MKKKGLIITGVCALALTGMRSDLIYANSEFDGQESDWLQKCSVAQDSEEAAKKCQEFKEYYAQESSQLEHKAADLQSTVQKLEEDMSNISEVVKELNTKIENLNNEIAAAEASVTNMQSNITLLDDKMAEKQKQIELLDEQVKKRMESEQVNLGTNRYIDVVMGASDLMDMVRLIEGINLVTQNDQEQMEEAATARKEYQLQQEEQERLQESLKEQIKINEQLKIAADEGKKEQESLYLAYQEKAAKTMEEIQSTRTDIASVQGNIAAINTNVRDDIFQKPSEPTPAPEQGSNGSDGSTEGTNGSDNGNTTGGETNEGETSGGGDTTGGGSGEAGDGNTSLIKPISYGLYAGTWYYPGSTAPHLGADYSGPVGGAVVAPAKAIVLYAGGNYDNNGFLENWVGWPAGGGNTIHLLTQVNGTTYGISFFHLSAGIPVSAGQLVEQGQVIAYSGNSGNTTGPHLHVEVVNLGTMSVTEAQAQFAATADFAWGTGWGFSGLNTTCSVKGAPCREQPENLFGY